MHNWKSPSELQRSLVLNTKLGNIWIGLYVWEVLNTMHFERDVILRRKAFKWYLTPYFLGRYSQAIALFCLVIIQNSTKSMNCTAVYMMAFFMELAALCASINFALRTMAIWTKRSVSLGLWGLIGVHIILLVVNVPQNRSTWNTFQQTCVFLNPDRSYIIVVILRVYTMVFDMLILLLNAYKLGVGFTGNGQGKLVRLLLKHGLIYFIIGFLCNAISAAYLIWNPNFIIAIMPTPPASLLTTIAACRSVRYLSEFMVREGPPQFQGETVTGPPAFCETENSIEEQVRSRPLYTR